jgi:hypothetical protein
MACALCFFENLFVSIDSAPFMPKGYACNTCFMLHLALFTQSFTSVPTLADRLIVTP